MEEQINIHHSKCSVIKKKKSHCLATVSRILFSSFPSFLMSLVQPRVIYLVPWEENQNSSWVFETWLVVSVCPVLVFPRQTLKHKLKYRKLGLNLKEYFLSHYLNVHWFCILLGEYMQLTVVTHQAKSPPELEQAKWHFYKSYKSNEDTLHKSAKETDLHSAGQY